MKIVNNFENDIDYAITIGDGKFDGRVLSSLCRRFNGENPIIFHSNKIMSRKSGFSALNIIKFYPGDYGINSFIYIVDGEYIKNDAKAEICNYLRSLVSLDSVTSIQSALLINCRTGPHAIVLYCIIAGPEIYIEEEIAVLLKVKLGIEINLNGNRDEQWKERVKGEVHKYLKVHRIEKLIQETGISKLEKSFPNITAVIKRIEEENRSNFSE